jgi:replicative DNA helicase
MSTYAREQDFLAWLMSKTEMPEKAADIKPHWFSDTLHGHIFEAISALFAKNDFALPSAISDQLDKLYPANPTISDERRDYVSQILASGGPINPEYTLYAIREQGKRKDFKLALLAAVSEVDAGHDTYEGMLAAALGRIEAITMRGIAKGMLNGRDISEIGLRWLEARNDSDGELPGWPTGIPDLDEVIFGLKPGELITIAGASGMGKTTMATNIIEVVGSGWVHPNGRAESGKIVLVVSREMGETQIALRHFASQGDISLTSLQRGTMNDAEWTGLTAAVSKLSDMKVFYDLDSLTPGEIALKARQIKRKHGELGMIVVDHVGLLKSDQKRRARYEEISDITWALKNMAREMNIPVIQLAQISRDVKNRSDKRPILTDLADSSSIEKDSDIVIGMYRDDYYHKDTAFQGMGEAIVLKNRMGECKTIPLVFKGEFNKYLPCNWESYYEAQKKATTINRPYSNKGIDL